MTYEAITEKRGKFIDDSGCTWNDYQSYVWCEVLGFCGCTGESTEKVFEILKKFWDAGEKENYFWFFEYESKTPFEPQFQELTLFILDKAKLIEHGSSVRGSWLTNKGKDICSKLWGSNV